MEPVTKRVKIEIGKKSRGAATVSTATPSTSSSSKPETPVIEADTYQLALADLVGSHFLMKKVRARKGDNLAVASKDGKKTTKSATAPVFSQSKPIEAGPRVEIIDGKIVIKESSLMIGEHDATIQEGEYEEVEEGAHPTSRYSSFTDKKPSRSWGIEETRIFYNALRQCGIDFSMMQSFFPSRTRRELKLKFRREEAQHADLIQHALNSSLPLELAPFEATLGIKLEASVE